MEQKKEVQITILQNQTNREKSTQEEFFNVLKFVAPGTNLRNALDNSLKTGKGALIVVDNEKLEPIIDGGFRVNCRFTPQRLTELTKMDGAIILSKDLKKITHANILLAPDTKIKTSETGTRHKAAERTAKQIGTLVIAISERKHEINIFYKNIKYHLKHTDDILRKTNEQIQLLSKHRDAFDIQIEKLNKMELRNYVTPIQVIAVIQKGRIIQKLARDILSNISC